MPACLRHSGLRHCCSARHNNDQPHSLPVEDIDKIFSMLLDVDRDGRLHTRVGSLVYVLDIRMWDGVGCRFGHNTKAFFRCYREVEQVQGVLGNSQGDFDCHESVFSYHIKTIPHLRMRTGSLNYLHGGRLMENSCSDIWKTGIRVDASGGGAPLWCENYNSTCNCSLTIQILGKIKDGRYIPW